MKVCQRSIASSPQRTHRWKSLLYSLLVSSTVLVALPVEAGELSSWKFNSQQNQLEFSTNENVQPSAQLVTDPTRLVIDLPGIRMDRATVNEAIGGAIRSIRIGKFDAETTRLVIELAPGYGLNPDLIKFRGISPQQWVVSLPKPYPLPGAALPDPISNAASSGSVVVPAQPVANQGRQTSPVVIGDRPISSPPVSPAKTATIEAIELDPGSSQVVIRASQPIKYSSRWDRYQNAFRIDISAAQLTKNFKAPQLPANSPIQTIKLRQENEETVVLWVQAAKGVQIGQVSQVSSRVLALQFQRSLPVQTASTQQPAPGRLTNVTPTFPRQPPTPFPISQMPSSPVMPQQPRGRVIVVVDPGHGGPDPGAVGIGGLQEKGIVLDIGTKVAGFLQQQGIQTMITRPDDRDLDLEPRVQMAEQVNATVFVSIHANAIDMSRPDISGLETYYYQSGGDLAETIHQSVLSATGIRDRGVRTARFYVLRKTSMPSVLVEVGFVTGRDDAARLSNPNYRTQMAGAIARGILQYLQKTAKL